MYYFFCKMSYVKYFFLRIIKLVDAMKKREKYFFRSLDEKNLCQSKKMSYLCSLKNSRQDI